MVGVFTLSNHNRPSHTEISPIKIKAKTMLRPGTAKGPCVFFGFSFSFIYKNRLPFYVQSLNFTLPIYCLRSFHFCGTEPKVNYVLKDMKSFCAGLHPTGIRLTKQG
jgi:hypothetical protein